LPEAVPADVITTALYACFHSRQEHTFGEKMLSAVRFGLISQRHSAAQRRPD
jgi:6-phosphogluconate dehydrogenase